MKRLNKALYIILLVALATTSLAPGVGASARLGPQSITWGLSQAIDLTSAAAQLNPAVVVDSASNVYVVWEDYRNGNADIYFSQRLAGATTWSTPVKLNDDGTTAENITPAISVGGSYIYVVWEDHRGDDADIYSTRRLISGGAWEANKRVNQDRADGDTPNENDQKNAGICVDATGAAFAVWQDSRSGNKKTYYGQRMTGDSSWSYSEKVTSGEGGNNLEQYHPVIACRGSGSSLLRFLLWEDYRKGDADVFYTQRNTDGTWSPEAGSKVNDYTTDKLQIMPAVALDSTGKAWAVWLDDRLGNQQVYGTFRPSGGEWGAGSDRVSNGGALNSRDAHPRVVVAPDTLLPYVVWVDANGNLVYTYWNGSSWVGQAAVSDNNTGTHRWPDIASNATGTLYVVWSDGRGGGNMHIYFTGSALVAVPNESLLKAWPGGTWNGGRFYLDLTVHNSEPSVRSIIATVRLPNDFYFVLPTVGRSMSDQSSSGIIEVTSHALTWTLQLAAFARSPLPSWTVYVSTMLTSPTVLNSTAVITDNVAGSSNSEILLAPIIVNPLQRYLPLVFKR